MFELVKSVSKQLHIGVNTVELLAMKTLSCRTLEVEADEFSVWEVNQKRPKPWRFGREREYLARRLYLAQARNTEQLTLKYHVCIRTTKQLLWAPSPDLAPALPWEQFWSLPSPAKTAVSPTFPYSYWALCYYTRAVLVWLNSFLSLISNKFHSRTQEWL